MEPEKNAIYLNFTNESNSDEKNIVDLQGKLLYTWPYTWETEDLSSLINQLSKDMATWIQTRTPSSLIDPGYIGSPSVFSVYSCPSYWYKNALKDPSVYKKLLTYNKIVELLFLIDDTCENLLGDPNHGKYVAAVGVLIGKIMNLQYSREKEVTQDADFTLINAASPICATYILLTFDCAMEFRDCHGMTAESSWWIARQNRHVYDVQAWCGVAENDHFLNLSLRHVLRNMTSGVLLCAESLFLLENVHIPNSVRNNIYWGRCYDRSAFLISRSNDILGLEKEMKDQVAQERRNDNAVLLYMEVLGITFKESLALSIKEYNYGVMEFNLETKFLKNNPGMLHDLDDEEKNILYKSLDVLGELLARSVQGQLFMKRYGYFKTRLEKSSCEIVASSKL